MNGSVINTDGDGDATSSTILFFDPWEFILALEYFADLEFDCLDCVHVTNNSEYNCVEFYNMIHLNLAMELLFYAGLPFALLFLHTHASLMT
jgi:hypothetical protein